MPKCTFCGNDIPRGTGKLFVFATGKMNYFCGRTCEKNLLKLKRNPARTKWTEYYRQGRRKSGKQQ